MSRFLFVVPPLVGHVNPAVGVAAALAAEGHEVAWVGAPEVLTRLAGPRARVFPAPICDIAGLGRTERVRGPAALKLLWDGFLVPLAEATAPAVRDAIDRFGPDVVVADQQALAGGIVADERGLPWATSATTTAELVGRPVDIPLIDGWIDAEIAALRTRLTGHADGADPRFSPYLILAFSTEELTGPLPGREGRLRLVGPSMGERPAGPFPWEWLDPARPGVLISMGTVSADSSGRFLDACHAALRARPGVQAVLVDPHGGDREPDGNVLVRREVPQVALLPRMRAAVCHAGHNTVCEALWHGVPLVVAPIRDDQPIVAGQVVEAGAGVRLRFTRSTPEHIGAALDEVLTDPGYAAAAGRIGASFRAAGGAPEAARELAVLATAQLEVSR